MIKNFLAICFIVLSFGTNAQTINTENLSPEQISELNQRVEEMKKVQPAVSEKVRTEVEAWTNLGQNIGRATVGAAREIGIAANEFAQTPIGIITTVVVVYKLVGRDILKTFIGLFIFLFGTAIGLYQFRRRYNRHYEYKPVLFGAFQRKKVVAEEMDTEDAERVIGLVVMCGSWFAGSIAILS